MAPPNPDRQPPLLATFHTILQNRQSASALRALTLPNPPDSTDFSSNDFLSLSSSPGLRAAFLHALQPAFPLGSRGSRLLDGNSAYAEQLERDIAAFHGAPAALLFNSGYDANSGFFACVPQPGDVVLFDEYVHASAREGLRLSRAGPRVGFPHNSVAGLREALRGVVAGDGLVGAGERNVFVAVESVYSMDGDLAPLEEFVDCLEEMLPLGNGYLVVDEAHATGVFGPGGKGRVCELGIEGRVFARLHTFGKALGCSGAVMLCAPVMREYLVNYARPLIYSTFMSFPSLAAIRVVYDFMIGGGTEPLSLRLRVLATHLYSALQTLEPKCNPHTSPTPLLSLPSSTPKSPIFSLLTPKPRSLAKYCQEGGFIVRPIVPPTVPKGGERVRVCLHAGNTEGEIEQLVERIREWLDQAWGKARRETSRL